MAILSMAVLGGAMRYLSGLPPASPPPLVRTLSVFAFSLALREVVSRAEPPTLPRQSRA